jgi:hypothetical protein
MSYRNIETNFLSETLLYTIYQSNLMYSEYKKATAKFIHTKIKQSETFVETFNRVITNLSREQYIRFS